MNNIEQNNTFGIDGIETTLEQKAEVLALIETKELPLAWYKRVKRKQLEAATTVAEVQAI